MLNKIRSFLKLDEGEETREDVVTRGTNQINDLIAPDSIIEHRSFYELGNNLVRTLMVTTYPHTAYMGWLDPLYSYDENIDISCHITPWPIDVVINNLNKRLTEYASTMQMDSSDGKLSDAALEAAYQDALQLRQKLQTGQSKFFYQAIYITISAQYLDELNEKTHEIETILGTMQLSTRIAIHRQGDAFLTAMPIGSDYIKQTRNFDTESLSTCFPLTSAELTDMEGTPILYGINRLNNSPVMFDRFNLSNHNSVTLASSGYGKSYTVKLEALRYFILGTKIVIIDPEEEYVDLCEELGGQYIKLSTTSKDVINPLDIYEGMESHDSGYSFLASKIMDVLSLIELMVGSDGTNEGLTSREKSIVIDAIQDVYEDVGITEVGFSKKEEDVFFDDKDFITLDDDAKDMPTLSDLLTKLKASGGREAERVVDLLESYVTGVLDLFNGETNVDLNNDFIVFGTKDLEEGVEEVAMFVALEYVWGRIKAGNKDRLLLIVDEAWKMLNNDTSRDFLIRVAKTARKFKAGLSIVTQDTSDFVMNGGESIISNTSMQILLRQSRKDIEDLSTLIDLSENEKQRLSIMQVGEAIIYADYNKSLVGIISNDYEHRLCSTTEE